MFQTSADMLLFILVYLKQYLTQTMLGRLFGIKQPQANRWIHLLHPVVNCALERAECRPDRTDVMQLSANPDTTTAEHAAPFYP